MGRAEQWEGKEHEEFTNSVVSFFSGTVGLSSMAPGYPRSAPCADAGTASSTVFLRPFYLAVVRSNCTALVLSSPVDAQGTPFLPPGLTGPTSEASVYKEHKDSRGRRA